MFLENLRSSVLYFSLHSFLVEYILGWGDGEYNVWTYVYKFTLLKPFASWVALATVWPFDLVSVGWREGSLLDTWITHSQWWKDYYCNRIPIIWLPYCYDWSLHNIPYRTYSALYFSQSSMASVYIVELVNSFYLVKCGQNILTKFLFKGAGTPDTRFAHANQLRLIGCCYGT